MAEYQNQFYRSLLGYTAQRNISPQTLCDASNVSFAALQQNKCALTATQVDSLWRNAAHFTKDALIGLHFGESMQMAALGVIGQVIATSHTVGEALGHAGRMVHLITDMFQLRMEPLERTVRVELIPDEKKRASFPHAFRHMAEYLLAFVIHELDGLLLTKWKPELAQVSYDLKVHQEQERVFRCPVKAEGERIYLECSRHDLALPILTANYDLQKLLLQQIGTLYMAPGPLTLQHKVYTYLLANSYLYAHSLEAVAANFNISPRSLQRRLNEEGVTFLQIVEDVKKSLALHYLQQEQFPLKDIAFTLGYNETSAFFKAFKRWTGKTPTAYRTQALLRR